MQIDMIFYTIMYDFSDRGEAKTALASFDQKGEMCDGEKCCEDEMCLRSGDWQRVV